MPDYQQYQADVAQDVADSLKSLQAQPILFVGSGFARRYAKGPNWLELLAELKNLCPLIDRDVEYYSQKFNGDLPAVGSAFIDPFFEWAWSDAGKKYFPAALYATADDRAIYLKFATSKILQKLKPHPTEPSLQAELTSLRTVGAHAVITTNYDNLLEEIFPDYEIVVGQDLFRKSLVVVGEIFKIHGSIGDPKSLVFTQEDYEEFYKDKKYLSAKLMTYFVEHPLLFVGYKAGDPNIKSILHDIGRMSATKKAVIPNIYILQRDDNIDPASYPAREHVLDVGEDISVRIKSISASSFDWVYKAFSVGGTMEKVNLKALRALAHRMVNLIRTDIPTKNVQVNYEALEHAISNEDVFGKLFGVTPLGDPAAANANHPYTSEMLAQELGLKHWTATNKLIEKIKADKNFDMKKFDNVYHVNIKIGKAETSRTRKYSDAAVSLLKLVRDNLQYDIPMHIKAAQPK